MDPGIRLGVYALPFGYGPASNAVSIAEAIHARQSRGIEWTFISSGIGLELLARSSVPATLIDTRNVDVDESLAARLAGGLDGLIVLMHRAWANRLAPEIPVFFVPALGYMCQPDAFAGYPGLRRLRRYYVQDIFGGYERVRATGLPAVMPVAPIVDLREAAYDMAGASALFHLGGIVSPFPASAVSPYPAGIAALIRSLGGPNALVLTSAEARARFAEALTGLRVESLSHERAICAYRQADTIYTSPGLTCLLEAARLRRPVVPLPRENYSQVVNMRQLIAQHGHTLAQPWHFLARAYTRVGTDIAERIGVDQVAEVNRGLLADSRFQRDYLEVASSATRAELLLPAALAARPNGAEEIAADIQRLYLSRDAS